MVALIKPQFEAGRQYVGKSGVVRDPHVYKEVLSKVFDVAQSYEFQLQSLTFSPIKGGKGNIEFLAHFYLQNAPITDAPLYVQSLHAKIDEVIHQAQHTLNVV